jgi:hypothetical protein
MRRCAVPAPRPSKRRLVAALLRSRPRFPAVRSAVRIGAAVLLLATVATGCGPATLSQNASHGAGDSASQVLALPVATPSSVAASTAPAAAKPAAPVHPVVVVAASASTGGSVVNRFGAILPNARRTPGATNPAVTQATIRRTICVSGWTSTIRPSSSYTTVLKRSQLASGYAYHGDRATSDYEEDHLISLELGGSPTAVANLWPEPYAPTMGAHKKDAIENRLHSLVCSGALPLTTAQHAIATDWWAAYQKYLGSTDTSTPRPAPKPAPAPGPAPAPQPPSAPAGATAQCNDGTYSYSQHHQGTCSHHGGVAIWL